MNSSFALLYVLSAVTEVSACFCLHCHFFISLGSALPYNHQKNNFLSKTYKPIVSVLVPSPNVFTLCVPLCVDFVYITLLLRKGNSFYAIMILGPPVWLFNSKEYSFCQRRKLIISGSSKGVTVKELMSFFSYFQVCWSYVDMATQIPIIRRRWHGQGSRTQMDSNFNIVVWLVHQFACLESLSW